MRTLRDLQGGAHAGHGHDDEDEDDEHQDMFAGGEKSGLAVQNPNSNPRGTRDEIQDMLNRARQYVHITSHIRKIKYVYSLTRLP